MGQYAVVIVAVLAVVITETCADMMRKSIVFNSKMPKVFYCPQDKPTGMDKMYVKAKPIEKLCEYGGKKLPKHYLSDCYNDVDETEYACAEKRRIMKWIKTSNSTGSRFRTTTDPSVEQVRNQ
ncbi:uncharacterized protein LOC111087658 isoform X2 [Limulus polyphemus]|uniref:Uncharacterized protein LOC111087658 isoform X2 n=1 Tax=Limulus polyphemus TaxID=6850 RepID=A0ABM1T4F4_LIMPO|nr:uncharacterized protein LOC111087658 isoform X2 [Limulus polyphemus]